MFFYLLGVAIKTSIKELFSLEFCLVNQLKSVINYIIGGDGTVSH